MEKVTKSGWKSPRCEKEKHKFRKIVTDMDIFSLLRAQSACCRAPNDGFPGRDDVKIVTHLRQIPARVSEIIWLTTQCALWRYSALSATHFGVIARLQSLASQDSVTPENVTVGALSYLQKKTLPRRSLREHLGGIILITKIPCVHVIP